VRRYAGAVPYQIARALRDTGKDFSDPLSAAMRFGPDLAMSGIYALSVPGTSPGDKALLAGEDLTASVVGGIGASLATRALLGMTPLRRSPRTIAALAGVADTAGSVAASMLGPHPFANSLAEREKVKQEMAAEEERKRIYEQGLTAGQQLHQRYSPEEQIINAVIPDGFAPYNS